MAFGEDKGILYEYMYGIVYYVYYVYIHISIYEQTIKTYI